MVYISKKDVDTLIRAIPKAREKSITKLIKKIKFPPAKLVYTDDKKQIKHLLRRAFKEKRKIKINYYSFSSDEVTNRVIDIYQLHKDCIIAHCNLRKEERTFIIDRINKAALLNEKYRIPKNWTPESIILNN
mgnify:FL=1